MYSISDLKIGVVIELAGKPYQIISSQHLKLGRGGAIMQTKLRNLLDGSALSQNFKGVEKIQPASIERDKAQYLYCEGKKYFFMNPDTFDNFSLSFEEVGEAKDFLIEGNIYQIQYFQKKPINIDLLPKVDLKVIEAPEGVKGDTVTAATKKIILETGLVVDAPMFIKEGDIVRINTQEKSYVERVK